jgi:hypothetical protein
MSSNVFNIFNNKKKNENEQSSYYYSTAKVYKINSVYFEDKSLYLHTRNILESLVKKFGIELDNHSINFLKFILMIQKERWSLDQVTKKKRSPAEEKDEDNDVSEVFEADTVRIEPSMIAVNTTPFWEELEKAYRKSFNKARSIDRFTLTLLYDDVSLEMFNKDLPKLARMELGRNVLFSSK